MANYLRSIFKRISKDFKQKELIPVKLLFFVHMSTILVLYPYLTIHMRELGINVEETAIMSAITPVVGILMPPLAGMLADKIGNFKVLLALFSVFSGLSALLLLIVPIGRLQITYPDSVIFGISCGRELPFALTLSDEYPCTRPSNFSSEAMISVQSCGFVCSAHIDNADDQHAILHTTSYTIKLHDILDHKTTSVEYTLSPDDIYVPKLLLDVTNHEKLRNNEKYSTAVRKLSKSTFFFPSQMLYNFSCQLDTDDYNKSTIDRTELKNPDKVSCLFGTGLQKNNLRKNYTVGITLKEISEADQLDQMHRYDVDYIMDNNVRRDVQCERVKNMRKEHASVHISLKKNDTVYKKMELGVCSPRCIATCKRSEFCANKGTVIELDINTTFWSYLAVRVFISIIGGTAYTMFEGAVIAILREYKADYGLQRMYASFGGMISSPLSGLLIDYASIGKGYTDYRPVFFLYAGLKVASAVLMLFINLEFKSPAVSVISDVLAVMNIELISLFVAAFLLGSAWGYIESFLFWLLQDLGGTKSLMGLTFTVGGIFGIPLLAVSGPLIRKMGHANIIFIGFLIYAVRLFGYSIIYNPWLSLIFEAMECLTHSLCFTAAITYAARLSTVTTDTTIQGILGGLFYGVGKSAGSLVGGYLIKYVGMRGTFQIFAATSAIIAFVYLAFYHLYMKKNSTLVKEDSEKAKEKEATGDVNGTGELTMGTNKKNDDLVNQPKSVPYEDSLTNLAYEDTEFNAEEYVTAEDEESPSAPIPRPESLRSTTPSTVKTGSSDSPSVLTTSLSAQNQTAVSPEITERSTTGTHPSST